MASIKIGAQTYRVYVVPDLTADDGTKLDGQAVYWRSIIFLNDRMDMYATRQTLWHEVIHVILEKAGREADEGYIQAIASGIMDILERNPEMRTISKGDKISMKKE